MGYRKQQVESALRRAISQILARGLSDPRVHGMVSVTHVEVTSDWHSAFVYVSVLPEKDQKKSLHGLRHAAGHIHSLLRKAVSVRMVPRLEFRLDSTLKKQDVVLDAIHRGVHQDTIAEDQRRARVGVSDDSPAEPG